MHRYIEALEALYGDLDSVETRTIVKSLATQLIKRLIRRRDLETIVSQIVARMTPKHLSRDEIFEMLIRKIDDEYETMDYKLLDLHEQQEVMKQPGYSYWGHKIFTPDGGCLYAEDAARIVRILNEREAEVREPSVFIDE